MFSIYVLLDPRTGSLRYVGQTHQSLAKRLRKHLGAASSSTKRPVCAWIRQLAQNGLKPEIILLESHFTQLELDEAERFNIAYWRSLGCNLTNLATGGSGTVSVRGAMGAEQKRLNGARLAAMNRARAGQPLSAEHVKNMSLSTLGVKKPEGFGTKVAIVNSQRVWTDESRVKVARSLGGRPIEDETGKVHLTIRGAARELGVLEGNIRLVLRGKLKTTGGHTFRRL